MGTGFPLGGRITQQGFPPNGQLSQQTAQISQPSIPTRLNDVTWQQYQPVPDSVIQAVIRAESSGRGNPSEPKGEPGRGLMQVTPQVAAMYGVAPEALTDPRVNRYVGTRYLNELNHRFGGNLALALAAYNAGPSRVARGEIPDSTRTYVRKILEEIGNGVSMAIGEGTAAGQDLREVPDPWGKAKGAAPATPGIASPGLKPATDPWGRELPPKSTAEKLYERVRDLARTGIDYGIGPIGVDTKAGMQQYAAQGGPTNPNSAGAFIGRQVIPNDLTGAAETAGLAAVGGSELPMLARLAVPAAAGAAGAYAQGNRSPAGAAAEGAGSALGGEAIGGLTGIAGRALGENKFLADTSRKFAGAVGDVLNDIGVGMFPQGAAPKSAEELEGLFTRGKVAAEIDRVGKPISKQVQQTVSGMKFTVPEVKGGGKIVYEDVPLQQAEEQLSKLGDLGFTKGGGYKSNMAAREARQQAYKTRGQIAQKLNQIRPGMGDQWLALRKARGSAAALKRLFAPENGVISPATGEIDQPKLVKAILEDYEDLSRNLGEQRADQLLQAARHGSNIPKSDVPGERGHLRFHGGVFPAYHPGSTYKPTGNIPFYMQKAAQSPLRRPAALAIQRFIDSQTQGGQ